MEQLSPRYLTHKHASIYGCTLLEASVIGITVEICVVALASFVQFIFGYGLLAGLILFLLSMPIMKQIWLLLGKQKLDRPYGHLTIRLLLRLERLGLIRLPYFRKTGRLDTRRRA